MRGVASASVIVEVVGSPFVAESRTGAVVGKASGELIGRYYGGATVTNFMLMLLWRR